MFDNPEWAQGSSDLLDPTQATLDQQLIYQPWIYQEDGSACDVLDTEHGVRATLEACERELNRQSLFRAFGNTPATDDQHTEIGPELGTATAGEDQEEKIPSPADGPGMQGIDLTETPKSEPVMSSPEPSPHAEPGPMELTPKAKARPSRPRPKGKAKAKGKSSKKNAKTGHSKPAKAPRQAKAKPAAKAAAKSEDNKRKGPLEKKLHSATYLNQKHHAKL